MGTVRRDLIVRSGTTLGAEVVYETSDVTAAVAELVAGDRVWHQGEPWTVYSSEEINPTRWRVRLGDGHWWQPDLLLAPDATLPRAVAHEWDEIVCNYRDPYGRRQAVPAEVDDDGVTLILIPHTADARQWTTDLGHIIDGSVPPPAPPGGVTVEPWRMAYDYDLNATFVGLPGAVQVCEGMLVVQPSVAADVTDPLVLSEPGRVDLYVYRGDSGIFRVTITDPDGLPIDVTAASFAAQIRATTEAATVMATLDVTLVAGQVNQIDVSLTAEQSEGISSSGVWDLEMVMGSTVTLLWGNVILTADVTRSVP